MAAKPGTRPVQYTEELAASFCAALATERGGHRVVCARAAMPAAATVFAWRQEQPKFREAMNLAQLARAWDLAEEMVEIADRCDASAGAVAKARLQCEARKWLVGRLAASDLGDRSGQLGDGEAATLTVTTIERQIVRPQDQDR